MEEYEEDVGRKREVSAVRVPEGFEGEGGEGLVLREEAGAEADVDEGYGGPMCVFELRDLGCSREGVMNGWTVFRSAYQTMKVATPERVIRAS